jgi:uncharacterized membrane protein
MITTNNGHEAGMPAVIETVEVSVPVRTAYNQWTRFEEFPRFMEGVQEVHQVSDTLTHWKIEVAGVEREFDAEITEQRPDERIGWHSIGGAGHAGVVTFLRLDDRTTRVTLQLDTAAEGVVETLGDGLGLLEHRAKNDMERFKEYIEAQGVESGGHRGDVDPAEAPTVGRGLGLDLGLGLG